MDKLTELRQEIDTLDQVILKTLSQRVRIVKKIGKLKKKQHLPPLDRNRWQEVLASRLAFAQKYNLPQDIIKKLYNLIHELSLKIEETV